MPIAESSVCRSGAAHPEQNSRVVSRPRTNLGLAWSSLVPARSTDQQFTAATCFTFSYPEIAWMIRFRVAVGNLSAGDGATCSRGGRIVATLS